MFHFSFSFHVFFALISELQAFSTSHYYEDTLQSFGTSSNNLLNPTTEFYHYEDFTDHKYFEDTTNTIKPIDLEKMDHDLETKEEDNNDDDLEKKDYAHFGLIDKLGNNNNAESGGQILKNALFIHHLLLQYIIFKVWNELAHLASKPKQIVEIGIEFRWNKT